MSVPSTAPGCFEHHRDQLRHRPDCTFVDVDLWQRLIISPRMLRRCDDAGARVRGLIDTQRGCRFLIEEEALP